MATYKVVNAFSDADDNNTRYKIGDEYPKGNFTPSEERIEELSSVHPKYKRVFIEAVEDNDEEANSEEEEKEAIKTELESLGVSFHPNTGLEKLKEKLEEAKAEKKE
jgi:hypothetical protein